MNDPDLEESAIPAVATASYPTRAGNVLRPLVDGEPAFHRVCGAVESARRSVRATVTFMWADFQMPDDRGSVLDVLNRAAAVGRDVRLIFWRPDPETEHLKANAFRGSPEHIVRLERSQSAARIRWDQAEPGFCQHQKTWLIDAGTPEEVSWAGSISIPIPWSPRAIVAGIAGLGDDGQRNPAWIHSKLMIVDGEWGTVGSCNLHRHSLFGNGELNAAFWDRHTARAMLFELLRENLERDVSGLDDRAALQLFRATVADNARLFTCRLRVILHVHGYTSGLRLPSYDVEHNISRSYRDFANHIEYRRMLGIDGDLSASAMNSTSISFLFKAN